MISKLKALNFLRKHWLVLVIATVVAVIVYRTVTLEHKLETAYNELSIVEESYQELESRYTQLDNEFSNFSEKVNRELVEQEQIRDNIEDIRTEMDKTRREVEETLTTSADNTKRDYEEIMDRKPNLLENIFNKGTKGVADEFKNIDTE